LRSQPGGIGLAALGGGAMVGRRLGGESTRLKFIRFFS
jgi:hypothetical protein